MSMFTREQFDEYKGSDSFLEVYYYSGPVVKDNIFVDVAYFYTYEEYVNFFNKFYKEHKDV